MKFSVLVSVTALTLAISFSTAALADGHGGKIAVGITPTLKKLDFEHNGMKHTIIRNQDQKNVINPNFAKTSRKCPPFCIQPMSLGSGVQTLGEIEIIDYIAKMASGDASILVVDSRTPDWVERGTIPGAVNLPWTKINPKKGATTAGIMKIMQENFGVNLVGDADEISVDEAIAAGDTSKVFDFSNAKTLVMFCNGMWCGQSPNNIQNLLKFGYPAGKLKWYRGGMQNWETLGLSTVKPGK